MKRLDVLLLVIVYTASECDIAQCCRCEYFTEFQSDYGQSVNTSLSGRIWLFVVAYGVSNCTEIETQWEIVRADGETEVYDTQPQGDESLYYPDLGLQFYTDCSFGYCFMDMFLTPSDKRYDGAQITCSFRLPNCSDTPNVTDPVTINIQGLLEAPPDVLVEVMDVGTVNVSWSPPFTLDGVPILHYSLYIISHGLSVQRNTTDTEISLERPCVTTSYQITAWNTGGEGTPAIYEVRMFEAIVRSLRPGEICLSCSFLHNHITDFCGLPSIEGCLVILKSEVQTNYSFNITRHNDRELVLFDCFSIQEAGEYSVTVYGIEDGSLSQHSSIQLGNVSVLEQIDNTDSTVHRNVSVSEQDNDIDNSTTTVLSNVTIVHSNTELVHDTSAVAGLSTALCVVLVCLIIISTIFIILFLRRRSQKQSHDTAELNTPQFYENPEISQKKTSTANTATDGDIQHVYSTSSATGGGDIVLYEQIDQINTTGPDDY